MVFQKITFSITLSDKMERNLPTSGPGEMTAIDKHSAIIDHAIEGYLEGAKSNLESLGYTVEIDQ